ncbi:helix-turn-helix transcriptional regulator [Streptococcus sp. 263_SSPC]|uniref:helix-turn-helix transcriptional regulator n=1 Tax=Streptococcus sp. 263_SSPC TaxID=1579343 RepID=UPI00080B83BD|nr:helix-turn-helix transcriptional regulator [Streptococcus sp. 263_SSPC]
MTYLTKRLNALKSRCPEFKQNLLEEYHLQKISLRVIELRLELGLSQKEMADALGMIESQYCRLEKGKHNPTVLSLIEIADSFGFDLDIKLKKRK